MRKAILPATMASILAGGIVASSVLLTGSKTASAYTVDFNEGDYSSWDGNTYTFDWYENPTSVDNVITYTISSASDLAGLAVITNDLSDSTFNYITDKLSESDKAYATTVDDFEGKVVKLDTDVDLADFDWLGIGYPWNTTALTASTELVNTEGQRVTYNAVDYIPDDTVDPWVGDKNGNPISTRYKEYPEAELRFRDIVQPISTDSIYNIVENPSKKLTVNDNGITRPMGATYLIAYSDDFAAHADAGFGPWAYPVAEISSLDFEKDVVAPYTFKDIKGYTATKGFAGTFDGQNHKVKGLNPDTTWTDDTTERLTTYEPIARGLFSMLDEKGTIKDLAVKGKYDNEICSYSSLLCAYNYGLIDNCYVDGQMSQSLVEQIYPIARDYDPDGSVYELSSTAGTVMPSGNAGFMTSQNYGTISNSYTVGEVTQAFRQFGFFASTNYGTIKNCENRANLSSSRVTTDFHTDEWGSTSNSFLHIPDECSAIYSDYTDIMGQHCLETPDDEISWCSTQLVRQLYSIPDDLKVDIANQLLLFTTAAKAGVVGSGSDPYTLTFEEQLWIPALYQTEVGESVAANHLYGQYIETIAGGIVGINKGSVENCANSGTLQSLKNITDDSTFSAYTSDYDSLDKAEDVYDYIRPYNAYSLFSTAGSRAVIVGGIAGVNLDTIKDSVNSGDIYADKGFTPSNTNFGGSLIAVTANGFYCNDIKYTFEDGTTYYSPWGCRWWADDNTQNYDGTSEVAHYHYDRNMPYPMVLKQYRGVQEIYAGIVGANTGTLESCDNLGHTESTEYYTEPYDIAYCSNANNLAGVAANITHLITSNNKPCKYITNTNLQDIESEQYLAYNIEQTRNYNITCSDIRMSNVGLCQYNIEGAESGSFNFKNIVLNGTAEYVAQNMSYANFSSLYTSTRLAKEKITECTITDCLIDGYINTVLENDKVNGTASKVYDFDRFQGSPIANSAVNSKLSNIAIVDSNFFALGKFNDCILENIEIYNQNIVTDLPRMSGLGKFINCTLRNIKDFGDNAIMSCDNCDVSNLLIVGNISEQFVKDQVATKQDFDTEGYVRRIYRLEEGYLYFFKDSQCKDMYLESAVDFEFTDPLESGKFQDIPGILKAYTDTNEFDHCAVVTPEGMVSYTSSNITWDPDESIATDAKLVFSSDSAESGALAYYLDHGNLADRTYEYTVAMGDTVSIFELVPSSIKRYLTDEKIAELSEERTLPIYTRKKINESEDSYYRIKSEAISSDIGYISISVDRNRKTFSTNNSSNLFPKTEVFYVPGELVNIESTTRNDFELKHITLKTGEVSRELEPSSKQNSIWKFEPIETTNCDIQLLSQWKGLWDIEVEETLAEWIQINTSVVKASEDSLVYISYDVQDPDYAVSELYYYPYTRTGDNGWVIDTSKKYDINLLDGYFKMPDSKIRIYAERVDNLAELKDIVIAGVHGEFRGSHMITINLDASADVTNLAIDSVELSEGAVVSPEVGTHVDFSKPVEFTVTAGSGIEETYTVKVQPIRDGYITQFDLRGRHGVIDDEAGTITITLSESESVSDSVPYIVWSGIDITPEVSESQDFSGEVSYTVTSSTGELKTYQVIVKRQLFDDSITDFVLQTEDIELKYSVNKDTNTILVEYPYGTDVSKVLLQKFTFEGIDSNMTEGQYLNLTVTNKVWIVDDLGNTKEYSLVANEQSNPTKKITQFVLFGCSADIDQSTNTITITIPAKYDITNIAPDAIAFEGKSLTDLTKRQDFTKMVTYTVEGFEGASRQYSVQVIRK